MNHFALDASALVKRYHNEQRHSVNASDALFLRQAPDWQTQLPEGDSVVMVAADHRLLRAAETEGLAMLDPEQGKVTEVKSFLVPAPDGRT
jgi:predicted nucleic acid-binding protein